jgi:FG-GAP-like repeat
VRRIAPWLSLLVISAACSSSSKPMAPPPNVARTPTAGMLSRVNPNIIDETETGYIERLPKSDYIKVDDRHIRNPIAGPQVEFFKEDDQYYYVSVNKLLPEEKELQTQSRSLGPQNAPQTTPQKKVTPLVPIEDFDDLTPARVASPFRLEEVSDSGLPPKGMWRASFAVADMNGDGIPDIISPPPRMGDGRLRIWLGDGKGHFAPWALHYTEKGVPNNGFAVDYGGVAIGDIDHDGHLDVVSASHGAGLVSLFGDGKGGFTVVRGGLPTKEFSAQAAALVDAAGDGKLYLVASRDTPPDKDATGPGMAQMRVFRFLGRDQGWEFLKEGLVAGPFSNCVIAWDFNGDGKQDVLTGNHWAGETRLLWKSNGDGTFSLELIPVEELEGFHLAVAPSRTGTSKAPAVVDSFVMQTRVPEVTRAGGISVYTFENGAWRRVRVWRKKDPKASIYGLAAGDLDGDGLDDIVFADSERQRLRILLQKPDGTYDEIAEESEPRLDSPGQCVRLADVNGDGRLDIILSKTITSSDPNQNGGWNIYLNRAK